MQVQSKGRQVVSLLTPLAGVLLLAGCEVYDHPDQQLPFWVPNVAVKHTDVDPSYADMPTSLRAHGGGTDTYKGYTDPETKDYIGSPSTRPSNPQYAIEPGLTSAAEMTPNLGATNVPAGVSISSGDFPSSAPSDFLPASTGGATTAPSPDVAK